MRLAIPLAFGVILLSGCGNMRPNPNLVYVKTPVYDYCCGYLQGKVIDVYDPSRVYYQPATYYDHGTGI